MAELKPVSVQRVSTDEQQFGRNRRCHIVVLNRVIRFLPPTSCFPSALCSPLSALYSHF